MKKYFFLILAVGFFALAVSSALAPFFGELTADQGRDALIATLIFMMGGTFMTVTAYTSFK